MSHTEQMNDGAQYRRRLYQVMADGTATFEEKRQRALSLGRTYLGVENAHVERIDEDDTHEIVASSGRGDTFAAGTVLDAAKTFCQQTVEDDSLLAVSDAEGEGWGDHPVHSEHGVSCYLGAPITVENDTYGTVCFVDRAAREREFGPDERAFVELVAAVFGREMDAMRHERRLDERERRLDEKERALERSETKYESLVATAPDAIFLVDATDQRIVEANEAATELVGYDRERLVGADVGMVYPDDQREQHYAGFARLLEESDTLSRLPNGEPLRFERADGSTVPVEVSAKAVELDGETFLQGIARDVSERRQRQRELRVKNRAIDEADVGITIADATTADNEIVYVNERFADLTGYDAATIEGRNCRLLQGSETDAQAVAELAAGIAASESVSTELLNYRADGTPFWNQVTITPVADETGATSHYVGFQRDVTPRKRRERLITVLNRVLRHNLRNSVGVIAGLAESIQSSATGETAEQAATIAERGWDLGALGDKAATLDRAVHEETDARVRDVVPVVEAAVADARDRTDVDVACSTPDSGRALATDHLYRAVAELVENAVEHGSTSRRSQAHDDAVEHGSTSPGSQAHDDAEDAPVTVEVESEGVDGVRIHVSDDGPGLPANEQSVLDTGRETDLEHGSGLGLWLVNWIVTDGGGQVSASVDDGTTVTLRLRDPEGSADRSSPTVLSS